MTRHLWNIVIGGVALVALAGCGSSDNSTSAGAQGTTATTAAAVATTASSPAATAAPATTAPSCGDLVLSSNPEDTATNITSVGVSCADAQALVRKVAVQSGTESTPPSFSTDGGFTCSRLNKRAGDHGPPTAVWECASGASKVDFVRAVVL